MDKDLVDGKDSLTKALVFKGAKYVGSDTCGSCHEKEEREYKLSTHSKISVKEAEVKDCEMCHGPASVHIQNEGGKGNIINPKKDPSTCFACHTDKKLEFRLPYHHPVLEGKMGCSDCHNAHSMEIRPWSGTTMNGLNEACTRCHEDQGQPFVWEHAALREGCTACHKVHGSIHEKMLIARDHTLCLRCHTQPNVPMVGMHDHSDHWPQGTCYSAGCHTAVHGSNFSHLLRD